MPIPESVAKQVMRAIESLRSVQTRLAQNYDLDSRFGGYGRYEWEAYLNMRGEIEAAERTMRLFRELAPRNGVDADAQISTWGGCPEIVLSYRAREYGGEIAA